MEVVKSSEALESQILDDARGKANRILQEADREAEAISEEWRKKAELEAKRLDAERDSRIAAIRQELEASLPLDYMRARLSYIQETLTKALSEMFASLTPADLARIIGGHLGSIPPVFGSTPLVVSAIGIPPAEAKRIVEKNIRGAVVGEVKSMEGAAEGRQAADGAPDRGLIVETSDGRIRFRGTINELTALLLEEHREELVEALLGKDV